ncbi:PAQR family membrane homeostasis protein TrhA [Methyloligella solikamskensis]|uniref:Hemolysin III family protein n=1 Tax=Methyloligella solikamskensis TaxID=1177756 RepID=A0ABW3JBV6_9HYPH
MDIRSHIRTMIERDREAVPEYTLRERIADGCVHVIGVAASLIGLLTLLVIGVKSNTTLWVVSLAIYGLALVACFTCSACYNMTVRPKVKAIFHRLDHAAIFLLIAGTYTPFALMKMDASTGHTLLAVVWAIAAVGVVIKLAAPRYLQGVSTVLYLVQGWAVVAAWAPLTDAVSTRVAVLIAVGGVLYTIGVIFHLSRLPYQNAIWHGFVLCAASLHYAAVVDAVGS